jgi:hypothetical protein
MAVTDQQAHAMTSYFIAAYTETLGKAPQVNRNTAKSGWKGMLIDYTVSEAREIVDYYINKWESPQLVWFLYNYDKVVAEKEAADTRRAQEIQRRKVTQERAEEWRRRWQK